MLKVIEYLETQTDLEGLELADGTEFGYLFFGYRVENSSEELEIHVTFTNQVFINGEEQEIFLPFSVCSL
jgi:hypothetical protein